uniref:Uncharacterized protein n=1 Tax=Craspedostauros australis TaxID=1486917 RepID=A0A7R9ZRH3_9STRA|mmetsp:Transcript_7096/g.19263  ORF Transcript_7096/g.19263 Transcript_7096/m.19263 type:complete len:126 (+) Transcript_7096:73-450(+)
MSQTRAVVVHRSTTLGTLLPKVARDHLSSRRRRRRGWGRTILPSCSKKDNHAHHPGANEDATTPTLVRPTTTSTTIRTEAPRSYCVSIDYAVMQHHQRHDTSAMADVPFDFAKMKHRWRICLGRR